MAETFPPRRCPPGRQEGPALPLGVEFEPPDLSPWLDPRHHNGIPGFITRDSGKPGPHLALLALVHGNEIAGAVVLDRLLRSGLRPERGQLSVGFVNLAAFARFDPAQPLGARFVEEDMNRVWGKALLAGPRRSAELDRAREILPFLETVDLLVDLHSMLWDSPPLTLCPDAEPSIEWASRLGEPACVVIDPGHVNGRRLIDYERFSKGQAAACLIEAGGHWRASTLARTERAVARVLAASGLFLSRPLPFAAPPPAGAPVRLYRVSETVTAESADFTFLIPLGLGAEHPVIPEAGTLIARDGRREIRTPHADCLLVMPNPRPAIGHTAVRFARALHPPPPE
jgi:succinylglutamate desuccinylase